MRGGGQRGDSAGSFGVTITPAPQRARSANVNDETQSWYGPAVSSVDPVTIGRADTRDEWVPLASFDFSNRATCFTAYYRLQLSLVSALMSLEIHTKLQFHDSCDTHALG